MHWDATEVKKLEKRPTLPVSNHGGPELLVKFLLSFLQAVTFALVNENVKARDRQVGEHCLSEEQLDAE